MRTTISPTQINADFRAVAKVAEHGAAATTRAVVRHPRRPARPAGRCEAMMKKHWPSPRWLRLDAHVHWPPLRTPPSPRDVGDGQQRGHRRPGRCRRCDQPQRLRRRGRGRTTATPPTRPTTPTARSSSACSTTGRRCTRTSCRPEAAAGVTNWRHLHARRRTGRQGQRGRGVGRGPGRQRLLQHPLPRRLTDRHGHRDRERQRQRRRSTDPPASRCRPGRCAEQHRRGRVHRGVGGHPDGAQATVKAAGYTGPTTKAYEVTASQTTGAAPQPRRGRVGVG